MIPFDKKAIEICKEYKFAFFNHSNRVVYGEYINNSYLTKALPGITIENKEEMDLVFKLIGKEYIRIINPHYIEFFDPDVVEYENVSAPLCIIKNGHFTYANQKYTGKVPSSKMLEAANCIYPVISLCVKQKLVAYREDKLYTDFFKNTLDGISTVIYTYLSESKISKGFIVLLKRRENNCNVFFIANKSALLATKKQDFIKFVIPEKHYSFVSNRKEYVAKRLKKTIYLESRNTNNK